MNKILCLVLALCLLCATALAFTDSAGRTVDVDRPVTRVAASGPLAQMALMALAPDALVGLSARWEEGAQQFVGDLYDLPLLGQLYGTKGEINLEQIAAAAPQVVVDVGEPKKTVVEDLDQLQGQLGIPFAHVTMTLDTAGDAFRQLGALLGREAQGEQLAAYCDEKYQQIQAIMGKVGPRKVKLLYCLGDQGLSVIAKGSYHGAVIDMMADNLAVVEAPSSKGTGNEVDMEQLLLWDPDYILFAPDSVGATVANDPQWQGLKAIQAGNYATVPTGPYNWIGFPPSMQRYLGMMWMAKLLYPEYSDFDLYQEAADYYRLFYHWELTRDQFDRLTGGKFAQ